MLPEYVRIYGLVVVVGAGLFVVGYTLWRALVVRRWPNRYAFALGVILLAYPVGAGLKYGVIGPQWSRFYLADFGFPVAISYGMYLQGARHYDDILSRLRWRQKTLVLGFVLSLGWEIFSWLASTSRDAAGGSSVDFDLTGGFDPIDVLMYFLGAGISIAIIEHQRRWYQRLIREDEVAAQRQRQAARPDRNSPRTVSRPAARHKPGSRGGRKKRKR